MKKLTLSQARKLFEEDKIIYLKCSKVTLQMFQYSPWLSWCQVKKSDYVYEKITFDKIVNEFSYYNCNKELGLKVNYYAYL